MFFLTADSQIFVLYWNQSEIVVLIKINRFYLVNNFCLSKFERPVFLSSTVFSDIDYAICLTILKESNLQVDNYSDYILGSSDEDFDLFNMISGKNFISSCSTFALLTGLLHENPFSADSWLHYSDLLGRENHQCSRFPILAWRDSK